MADNIEHPTGSSSPQQFRGFPELDRQTPQAFASLPDGKQFRTPLPAQPALPDENQPTLASENQVAIPPSSQPAYTPGSQFAPSSASQVEPSVSDLTTLRNGEHFTRQTEQLTCDITTPRHGEYVANQTGQSLADLTTLRHGEYVANPTGQSLADLTTLRHGTGGNTEQIRPVLKLPARPTLKNKARLTPADESISPDQAEDQPLSPTRVSQMPTIPVTAMPVGPFPTLPNTPMPTISNTPISQLPTAPLSHVQETRAPYNTLEPPEQFPTAYPQSPEMLATSRLNTTRPPASSQHPETSPIPRLDIANPDPSSLTDLHLREQAQRYAQWLTKQTKNEKRDTQAEIDAYRKEATVLVKVGEQEIAPFAPFRPELSALQTFTRPQVATLCILAVCATGAEVVFKLAALTAVVSAITVIYTLCLLLNLFMAFKALRANPEERIDDEIIQRLQQAQWPMYTILCPLYKEAQVVPQFVQAMQALDYPQDKLQILFLTEEHDRETRAAICALSLPAHFQILVVPDGMPRTKPRACNYGLLHATGSYTVIYDAENIPDPLQLKKALLAFANSDLQTVCVQAKLNFYNSTQNSADPLVYR